MKRIRNHYIPQHYLRGFSTIKGQIFFCEKGSSESNGPTALINVAQEKGFYSKDTEQKLGSSIESDAEPILAKIRKRESITANEKIIIAQFIAIMIRRVPKGWEQFRKIPQNAEKLINRIEPNHPNLHSELEELRQKLQYVPDEWKNNFPKHLWDQSLVNYPSSEIVNTLCKMTWRFYVSDKPPFLTSDNPVVFYNIDDPNGTVRFPISSFIALEAANWHVCPDLEFYPANEAVILGINQWIVAEATHYIFHDGNIEWVLQRLNM